MTLKRTGFKPRTAPMKASAFKRIDAKESGAVAKARTAMKRKGPKMTPIRASARGEQCTLRFPCCNFNPETTAWCHSNSARDGKGMGIKARDVEGAYGCSACHAFLDGGYAGKMPRDQVDLNFNVARLLSQAILRRKGLIKDGTAAAVTAAIPDQTQSMGKDSTMNMISEQERAPAADEVNS